eukprot:CAMPEP_0206548470 /NCGR_PEP_ID=MMETSP0325_2-20121206/13903_1 /ASSEMBLY_ACC=CAM_ASM_000347 /TAXON_ID=2866 /ORGANISM="Crypthecodinium cohnii, Strain Seligo" /LENGTH=284 /DNA_ID=CAMNT_0054047957 /DNA_START=80 /DNA_END=934 /DNA_ORIENTATION=-
MPGLLAQHFASFLDLDHAHAQQAADFLNSPSLSPSDLHGGLHHHQQVAVSDLSNNNNNNSTALSPASWSPLPFTGSSAARGSRSCFLEGPSAQGLRRGREVTDTLELEQQQQPFSSTSSMTSKEQQRHAKQVAYTSFLPGMVFHAPIDFAGANSVYTLKGQTKIQSPFNAKQALQPGSGYWCSTGRHKPEDVVIWKGTMKRRKKISGIKVSWAYAPSEVRVEVTPDGEYWDRAVDWHNLGNNVSFEEEMTFDRPRNVKAMKIEMRGPREWNYMGINQATLVVAS